MALYLARDPEADELLASDPLALLIGMVLDQQVPMERAFGAPAELRRRIGSLDPVKIAGMDPEELAGAFARTPALHRFPGSMARRVQEVCRIVVDRYGGDAGLVWGGATSGRELVRRLKDLPGFGDQKARIFLALLGKQLGARPSGWRTASDPYGESKSFRSVADIVDEDSFQKVRAFKQAMKAGARAPDDPKAPDRRKRAATKAASGKTAGSGKGEARKSSAGKRAPARKLPTG